MHLTAFRRRGNLCVGANCPDDGDKGRESIIFSINTDYRSKSIHPSIFYNLQEKKEYFGTQAFEIMYKNNLKSVCLCIRLKVIIYYHCSGVAETLKCL